MSMSDKPLIYAINGKHHFIHTVTIEEFMKQDPPCNQCLIQTMCISETFDGVHTYIRLSPCNEFIKYLGISK